MNNYFKMNVLQSGFRKQLIISFIMIRLALLAIHFFIEIHVLQCYNGS